MSNEQKPKIDELSVLDEIIGAEELDINGLLAEVRRLATQRPEIREKVLVRIDRGCGGDIAERAAKEWASATAQPKAVPKIQPKADYKLLTSEVFPPSRTAQGSPRPLPRRKLSGALTVREQIDALIAKALKETTHVDVAPKPFDRGEERAGSNPYRATEEPAEEAKPESEGKPECVESPAIKWRPPVDFDEPIYDPGRPILSPGAGYDNAREFAGRECWRGGELVLFRWNGTWWRWDGRAYAKISEEWMRRSVVKFLDEARRWETVKNGRSRLERFTPSKNQVTEALSMLESGLLLPDNFFPPMRLDDPEAEFGDVMIFKNGMVDLRTGKFVSPSPRLWVHGSVDYEWDCDARCPEWEQHLKNVWPDDPQSWDCAEEFGGYGMTYDVSFQKGLLLVGAPRSGKGLLLRIMEWINGSSAVVAPNLATWLKGEKSTQGLIGKKWIVFPDMRLKPPRMYGPTLDPGGLPHDSLGMLLSITSGDSVEIGQMWTQSWKGRLPGNESHRVCRRPQLLRGWGYDKQDDESVFS